MRLITYLLFACSFIVIGFPTYANDESYLQKQRKTFQLARKALETNQLNLFSQYKKQLEDYPLQGYLQYLYLRHRLNQVTPQVINAFLADESNTFYAGRLRKVWLQRLAREENWLAYLSFYQSDLGAEFDCLQLHALIATNQKKQAFAGTEPLWLVPYSQHKACDLAFSLWDKEGHLTEDMRWQRMLLALRNNQYALATFLAKSMAESESALAWVRRWQTIHDSPLKLLNQLPTTAPSSAHVSLALDTPLSREIIQHGITRLARLNTEKAYQAWLRLKAHYQFTQEQQFEIRQSIGLRAALSRDPKSLTYFGDIKGGEWHIRAALWQQDWKEVERTILGLPIQEQTSTNWQYWLGRAQSENGENEKAQETFANLAHERDYYAFLAADQLDRRYQMNHRPIIAEESELEAFRKEIGMQRLHEFYLQNMTLEATREAYHQRLTRTPRELQLMASITHEWGWHNQTIAILGNAKYWDALDLRFPVLYDTEVHKAGKKNGLDPSWLLAIARQESAFNPTARSHAGAMGLMQLMPNTGKLISKLINRPLTQLSELYNGERNIELGSAYLKKMYDENQRNPVLATAAYNAGPHRVAKWLPSTTLPADIWAENIPFNETRHYVKSVMSYAAIFDSQRNQTIKPLSERMPAVKPK